MCIMEHGNIPLLLWWIILLSPKPSPESRRTLSNVVIGKNIIIRHPNQLLFSLSSFLDIFYKIYIKTRKKSEFYLFLTRKRSEKTSFRPEKCQKNPDTQARISHFPIGVLASGVVTKFCCIVCFKIFSITKPFENFCIFGFRNCDNFSS